MTRAIYFDESGYTGKALLDPAQPHFVLASSLIDDERAEAILRRCFPSYAGEEFKFERLWSKPRSRACLLDFAANLAAHRDELFVWIIDKRFCVLTKIIDFLVEPVLHDLGHDFYRDSYAPKFSNYIHWGLLTEGEPELYEATLRGYYDFAREPTDGRLEALQWRFSMMATSVPERLRFFYEIAACGALAFHRFHNIATFKDSLEIHLTSVLGTMGYWRNRVSEDFELFHDASKGFFGQARLWSAITSDLVPPQRHPQANAPPLEFPLRVLATHSVDSKDSYAIQLCDAVAGLATRTARAVCNPEEVKFVRSLVNAGVGVLPFNGIRPETDFPNGPPAFLDGPDAVDKMATIVKSAVTGDQLR